MYTQLLFFSLRYQLLRLKWNEKKDSMELMSVAILRRITVKDQRNMKWKYPQGKIDYLQLHIFVTCGLKKWKFI